MAQVTAHLDLAPVLGEVVDWHFKAFPPTEPPITIADVGRQGWNALDGDLLFPVMLLKERALQRNIEIMARYCLQHDISLAPHVKTPLSPQIAQRQLDAGAWGLTVATIAQARVFRAVGARRILLANELLGRTGLGWVAGEMGKDIDLWFACLIDSVDGVNIMSGLLGEIGPVQQLPVLVEMGASGGRSGVRSVEEGLAVAEAVQRSAYLTLIGVEGYEGAIKGKTPEEQIAGVDRFLEDVRRLTERIDQAGLFAGQEEIIVSAGGSKFFDRVAEILGSGWDLSLPVRTLIRSGSYMAHDVDSYDALSPLAGRGGGTERLQPALELWGMVLSRPEPDLAIADFGKRDSSYDIGLPVPLAQRRGGEMRDIRGLVTVTALNDQHAFLRMPADLDLIEGDVIGCGLCHPCTAFDKWDLVPLVDDDYRVTGAIRCYF